MINVKRPVFDLFNIPFYSLNDAMNRLLIELLWIDGDQGSVPNDKFEAYVEVYLQPCIN